MLEDNVWKDEPTQLTANQLITNIRVSRRPVGSRSVIVESSNDLSFGLSRFLTLAYLAVARVLGFVELFYASSTEIYGSFHTIFLKLVSISELTQGPAKKVDLVDEEVSIEVLLMLQLGNSMSKYQPMLLLYCIFDIHAPVTGQRQTLSIGR